jgi:predicted protein tyrosine phosphatase
MSIKEFVVLSKKEAATYTCDRPWAAISISTMGDGPPIDEKNRVALLRMKFADVVRPDESWIPEELMFNQTKACEIIDFTESVWDEIDVMMVHCEMGISRSPATAAALAHCLHGPETENLFFATYTPNTHVYKTILKEYYRREGKPTPNRIPESQEKIYDKPWNPLED